MDRGRERHPSSRTAWCLLGCAIGDLGTIAYFQYTGTDWPMMAVMRLAVLNGILTSIALETAIMTRQMGLKLAFRTAIEVSIISMLAMELAMNAVDVALTGTPVIGRAHNQFV